MHAAARSAAETGIATLQAQVAEVEKEASKVEPLQTSNAQLRNQLQTAQLDGRDLQCQVAVAPASAPHSLFLPPTSLPIPALMFRQLRLLFSLTHFAHRA